MKGIVFTEFLEMVEQRFGLAMVDHIIEGAAPASGGAYTAVGTYPCRELLQLVGSLATATATPAPQLVQAFGHHLFGRFHEAYPVLFEGIGSAFAFLRSVEHVIHVEVRKLYPDAELPSFEYETPADGTLVLLYSSQHPFADLAEGLIRGCILHYGKPIDVARQDLPGRAPFRARFTLTAR
jgi:hypothetical protein